MAWHVPLRRKVSIKFTSQLISKSLRLRGILVGAFVSHGHEHLWTLKRKSTQITHTSLQTDTRVTTLWNISFIPMGYIKYELLSLVPLAGRTRCNQLSTVGVLLLSKPVLRVHYIVCCTWWHWLSTASAGVLYAPHLQAAWVWRVSVCKMPRIVTHTDG